MIFVIISLIVLVLFPLFMHKKTQLLWEYAATITQPNAGATTCGIRIQFNNGQSFELIFGQVGPDNYAADRDIQISHLESSNGHINYIVRYAAAAIDNESVRFPSLNIGDQDTASVEDGLICTSVIPYPIFPPDRLLIQGVNLAQNETITIKLRAWVNSLPATRTIIGANATETNVVNRIIGSR